MKRILLIAATILASAPAAPVVRAGPFDALFPSPSTEVVKLDPAKRATLKRLRAEKKFQPNDYPPLGYTGMATPEDEATANAALDGVIDGILTLPDGPVPAKTVSDLFGTAMTQVDLLETEDRDQTQGYLLEIWYIMGFKGATGRFAYGSAFPVPKGYGEPLPPGWTAPDHPRPIR
jgi:hypothetical protein